MAKNTPPSSSKDDEWESLPPAAEPEGTNVIDYDQTSVKSDHSSNKGIIPTIRTRLFGHRQRNLSHDDTETSSLFRPGFLRNYGSMTTINTYDSRDGYGGTLPPEQENGSVSPHAMLGDAVTDGLLGGPGSRTSTTQWLASRHGVKHDRTMYVAIEFKNQFTLRRHSFSPGTLDIIFL